MKYIEKFFCEVHTHSTTIMFIRLVHETFRKKMNSFFSYRIGLRVYDQE